MSRRRSLRWTPLRRPRRERSPVCSRRRPQRWSKRRFLAPTRARSVQSHLGRSAAVQLGASLRGSGYSDRTRSGARARCASLPPQQREDHRPAKLQILQEAAQCLSTPSGDRQTGNEAGRVAGNDRIAGSIAENDGRTWMGGLSPMLRCSLAVCSLGAKIISTRSSERSTKRV